MLLAGKRDWKRKVMRRWAVVMMVVVSSAVGTLHKGEIHDKRRLEKERWRGQS